MTSLSHWDAGKLARLFHETYERLAPEYGYETQPESSVAWECVPTPNRMLMIAVADEVLREIKADTRPQTPRLSVSKQTVTARPHVHQTSPGCVSLRIRGQA